VIKLDRRDAVWILTIGDGENRFRCESLAALHAALDTVQASDDFVVMRSDRGYCCLPEADLGLPLTPASLRRSRRPRRSPDRIAGR